MVPFSWMRGVRRASVTAGLAGAGLLAQASLADDLCEPAWDVAIGQPGTEEWVRALAVFDDGAGPALFAGGSFITGQTVSGLWKWVDDQWVIAGGPVIGSVDALVVFDDGTGPALYAGGFFTTAGAAEVMNIARWDGQQWSDVGGGVEGTVDALTVFDDGAGPALYAGGTFMSAGGVPANRVAKWDGTSWTALDSGMNSPVLALTVFDDGTGPALYAGGQFFGRVAKWDHVVQEWFIVGSGINNVVTSLAVFDDGTGPCLYAGGFFTTAGGASASKVAKWDGKEWSPLGQGVTGLMVAALEPFDDGVTTMLYVGGQFTAAGGAPAAFVARWNGHEWSDVGEGVNDRVQAFEVGHTAPAGNGRTVPVPTLHVGGRFTTAGGSQANHVATWSGGGLIDSDGDGVPDCWEIHGIPYIDADGNEQRYELPAADPMRKNLWIEVDSMAGFSLSDDAVEMLEFVFDFAPVSNPGGESGIILHVQQDESNLPHAGLWETDGCWPTEFYDTRALHFGTAEERDDPSAEALLEAKAKAFRYAIVADQAAGEDGKLAGLAGCGETPGDNLVVFHGANMFNHPDPHVVAQRQAGIFMHELGHNLGLRHGGGDCINGKPNYPSVMNYLMTIPYPWNEAFWKLDYSRAGETDTGFGVLQQLDESCLNEEFGIGTPGGFYAVNNTMMPIGVSVELFDGTIIREVEYVPLNGSPIDFGDPRCTGQQDGDVFGECICQDLNHLINTPLDGGCGDDEHPYGPSPDQVLSPHNDWAKIVLATAAIRGDAAPAVSFPQNELTDAMVEEIEKTFPVPEPRPPVCPGDLTGDGTVGVDDLLLLLAAWGECDDVEDCPADLTGDLTVGVDDLLALLAAWGECD